MTRVGANLRRMWLFTGLHLHPKIIFEGEGSNVPGGKGVPKIVMQWAGCCFDRLEGTQPPNSASRSLKFGISWAGIWVAAERIPEKRAMAAMGQTRPRRPPPRRAYARPVVLLHEGRTAISIRYHGKDDRDHSADNDGTPARPIQLLS